MGRSNCREGSLESSKLHEVVLVGGCARIPRLQTAFKDALGKAPTIAKERDSAARGAAVQVFGMGCNATRHSLEVVCPVLSCRLHAIMRLGVGTACQADAAHCNPALHIIPAGMAAPLNGGLL